MNLENKKSTIERYRERLLIPEVSENELTFVDKKDNFVIAIGYERVVLGGRGPYVEFSDSQIIKDNLFIPEDKKWKLLTKCYYHEYRTIKSDVKVYYQINLVDYADYKKGFWYISPFDLLANDNVIILSLKDPCPERNK